MVKRSKCLPQGYEYLRGFDSAQSVEVVPEVDPDRADGRGIAQAYSEGVCVVRSEVAESDVLKNISSVIKGHQSKPFPDGQGNAKLRIQYEEFAPASRYPDLSASRRVGWIATHGDRALRSSPIQGEPS